MESTTILYYLAHCYLPFPQSPPSLPAQSLDETRMAQIKMIELKNIEAEMSRLHLIQAYKTVDDTMAKSFQTLNDLVNACVEEQRQYEALVQLMREQQVEEAVAAEMAAAGGGV